MAELLSPLDTAFLALERLAPMHLGALAILDSTPASLADLLADRAGAVPRLRQRPEAQLIPPGAMAWTETPGFDARRNIHTHRLVLGDWAELSALTSQLMSEPLSLSAPLWELHLIEGLDEGRIVLLVKLHHALCDGRGALRLGAALLDPSSHDAVPHPAAAAPPPTTQRTRWPCRGWPT
ncbi:wax ester/triacylglycerol synthase domain-containing protein [Lentzea flava]|uniref:diacylglycerol O-acyltransferase n=1 Tax=Lentzea flava TaxID=103732 RepID=A0ABQ2VHX4_9PSEU|nr:wax ester/triacylglycerol synthase domain-containing protein [Lentzea flava]MCP2205466.1 Wax ester synthase-like Acyl-CoA acyltransferase domain-containing protein [Lentzea flava]GGU87459.1 hypothetical protein GCM10010178_91580 [Lentzea flava]